MNLTLDQLTKIAAEREEWAKDAHDKDLHGTAKELELTAALAREVIECRERYGAVADAG